MCEAPGSVGCAHTEGHVAASWVHESLGFRVFPSGLASTPMGLMLDPSQSEIQCMYPTDAGTDGRDKEGCGPMMQDPEYGSQGGKHAGYIQKYMIRKEYDQYKKLNYGDDAKWVSAGLPDMDIRRLFFLRGIISYLFYINLQDEFDCHDTVLPVTKPCLWDFNTTSLTAASDDNDDRSSRFRSNNHHKNEKSKKQVDSLEHMYFNTYMQYAVHVTEALLGHHLCNPDTLDIAENPPTKAGIPFIYMGKDPWQPTVPDLHSLVHTQQQFIDHYQDRGHFSWNEFVVANPARRMRDILHAVFVVVPHKQDHDSTTLVDRKFSETMDKQYTGTRDTMQQTGSSTVTSQRHLQHLHLQLSTTNEVPTDAKRKQDIDKAKRQARYLNLPLLEIRLSDDGLYKPKITCLLEAPRPEGRGA